jgi:uncharacterized membrane protein YtjA (UPF0391 family)
MWIYTFATLAWAVTLAITAFIAAQSGFDRTATEAAGAAQVLLSISVMFFGVAFYNEILAHARSKRRPPVTIGQASDKRHRAVGRLMH